MVYFPRVCLMDEPYPRVRDGRIFVRLLLWTPLLSYRYYTLRSNHTCGPLCDVARSTQDTTIALLADLLFIMIFLTWLYQSRQSELHRRVPYWTGIGILCLLRIITTFSQISLFCSEHSQSSQDLSINETIKIPCISFYHIR